MADVKRLNLEKDFEHFKYSFETFIIGQEIIGFRAEQNLLELVLTEGRSLSFQAEGPDIVITLHVPGDPAGPTQVM